jgi:hypothetical protein
MTLLILSSRDHEVVVAISLFHEIAAVASGFDRLRRASRGLSIVDVK